MARTSGPGPRPAVDLSASLKISGSHSVSGANYGIMSSVAVGVFYEKNPTFATEAVKGALKRQGLRVRDITADSSMIVELDFDTKKTFRSFVKELENKKVKENLERKLQDIGFKGKLDVTIANKEEVDNKMDQTR